MDPMTLLAVQPLVFACHSAACAPPSAGGTGGSLPGASGGTSDGRPAIDVSRGGTTQGVTTGSRSHLISEMTPKAIKQMMDSINTIPGMEHLKTPEEAVAAVVDRLKATAELAIANGYTPEMAQSAAHWYDVANEYAHGLAHDNGYNHPETAAAVLAALSPSAAWESNVYNAKQILEKVSKNPVMTSEDVDNVHKRMQRILTDKRDVLKKDKKPLDEIDAQIAEAALPATRDKIQAAIEGKKFNDLPDDMSVMVLHGETQATGAKGISLIPHPDGTFSSQPDDGKAIIQSNSNVIKSLRIARGDLAGANADEMGKIISNNISQESKVRAFYMNIAFPNDNAQRAITADTHFYSSATGIPLNAKTAKPFFTGSSEVGFAKGYPVYRQALEEMMPYFQERLGVKQTFPRSGQSVSWEMERFLVPEKQKGTFIKNGHGQMDELARIYRDEGPVAAKLYYFNQTGASPRDRVAQDGGE